MAENSFIIRPLGIIKSPFEEKFGIPRQPGIAKSAISELIFHEPYACDEAFRGLEGFSHLWVIFIFNDNKRSEWKPTVRPPRQGGNTRMGVFATRSPYRPNPVGISAVKIEGWKDDGSKKILLVSGGDFLDSTPFIDIKPYLPYTDSIPDAEGGFASEAPDSHIDVIFSNEAEKICSGIKWNGKKPFIDFLTEILSQDPRPAFHSARPTKKTYAMKIWGYDIHWEAGDGFIKVTDIKRQ